MNGSIPVVGASTSRVSCMFLAAMTGGATGRLVEEMLDEAAVPWQALRISGRNRVSLNVHDLESGLEYRFVPEGPAVSESEWRSVLAVLAQIEAEWIVASGSLPPGVPDDFYARAAAIAARRGQKFALDTSGPALRAGATQDIALLKLSLGELEFLAERKMSEPGSQEEAVRRLIGRGSPRMVAVSLGAEGALLMTCNGTTRLPALPVEERGAVGAGDSFLAGLLLGLVRGWPEQQALRFALAAGAAAVATYGTAQVARDHVEALYRSFAGDDAMATEGDDRTISTVHSVAAELERRGHGEHSGTLRAALRHSHAGVALFGAVREACQVVLTAIEAIDPVCATMVEELRLEVDARLLEHRPTADGDRS
jgi:6-phosphofructokinase 2